MNNTKVMMFRSFYIVLLCSLSGSVFAHGMSAQDQALILNAGYMEYMQLGATHMLSGYDHLLFLFGVVFFLTRLKDIVKFITAFTVGHSITLVFATVYSIQANYYLIDAVIALTVCYKAFDNLDGFKKTLQMASPNLLLMVFLFGLIHGFGLSTRLQQLPLSNDGLVPKILSFNVGVELGQIVALSIMLLVLAAWRKRESFLRLSKVCNVALMAGGILLFLMQLHSYQHSEYPDDFPLNQDDHHHAHEEITSSRSPLSNYEKRFELDLDVSKLDALNNEAQDSKDTHSHNGEAPHTH